MKKTPRIFQRPVQPREGARPRAPRRPAALLASYFFLLACCVLPAASAADLALDGRWLDAGSNVVANTNFSATMNVYTNDTTNAVAVASATVTLATDADGFFRAVATDLALPAECRTYWLGVTPDGGTEIAPRMRVSPAPYALRAAEAALLDTDRLTVDGTVTIGRLTNATATVGTVAVSNDFSLQGGLAGNASLYLDGIDLSAGNGARLALFRKGKVVKDSWLTRIYVDHDAIASIRLLNQNYYQRVALSVRTGDIHINHPDGHGVWWYLHHYFITIPVRKGSYPEYADNCEIRIDWGDDTETTIYYGGVE